MEYGALKVVVALVLVMNNVFGGGASVRAEGSLAQQAYDSAIIVKDTTGRQLDLVKSLVTSRNPKPDPPIIKACTNLFNWLDKRASEIVQDLEDLSGNKNKVSSAVKTLEDSSTQVFRCRDLIPYEPRLNWLHLRIDAQANSLAYEIGKTKDLANQLLRQR